MDYDEVLRGAFGWVSFQKVAWFLVFLWLAFPVLLWVPQAAEGGAFVTNMMPLVYFLYDLTYLCAIIGFICITQTCLKEKGMRSQRLSFTRFVDTIFLVFVEMWFVFVWNLNRRLRVPQILLLMAAPLLYWFWLSDPSFLLGLVLALFVWAYFSLVVYNGTRVFFSMMSFYNKDVSVIGAVKESWVLTHHRFVETISSIVLSLGAAVVLFSISAIVIGAIGSLALLLFFTEPVAYSLVVRAATILSLAPAILAYNYAAMNVYSQLVKESESSATIRKILAKKVLSRGSFSRPRIAPKRSFARKKAKKKRK